MNTERFNRKTLLPLALAIFVIIADQITKQLIVMNIPAWTIGADFFGGALRIVHVANTGVAFSLGGEWPLVVRRLCFGFVPLVVMILVIVVYFRNKDFNQIQRWAISGIVGGGFGNIIDRFFRAEGVVDFIDCVWFGIESSPINLFKMKRWPTFNVADMAVVICGIMLIVSFVVTVIKEEKSKK